MGKDKNDDSLGRRLIPLPHLNCLYFIGYKYKSESFLKAGVTNNLKIRLPGLQVGCPHQFTFGIVVASQFRQEVEGFENLIKYNLHIIKFRGEWFQVTPAPLF